MADQKKQGFYAKYFAARHSSCCEMKIEEVGEATSAEPGAQGTSVANQKTGKGQRRASSCCGDNSDPKSGGGCCG